MGLLEKALHFKKSINKQGKETLIDTIKGPAETDFIEDELSPRDEAPVKAGVVKLDQQDLMEISEDEIDSVEEQDSFDYMLIHEVTREIVKSRDEKELYDSLLFAVMGHIGVSSNSIMINDPDNVHTWRIAESRGVTIEDNDFTFDSYRGVLNNVITQKTICDLEDYKDNPQYSDDYYKFLSVDTRMLIPIIYDDQVIAILMLGEKISEEPLDKKDTMLLNTLIEYTAPVLKSLLDRKNQKQEIESIDKSLEYIKECDMFLDSISEESGKENINVLIQNKMRGLGIEHFAVFTRRDNKYVPIAVEKEDVLMLSEMNFSISVDKNIINFIQENSSPVAFDNINKSRIISEVFNKNQIKAIDRLRLYSFKMNDVLMGFIMLFKIGDENRLAEIDLKMKRISNVLFSYLNAIINLDVLRNKYIDNVDAFYSRIEHELINAKNLNIPVTIILFSIKNYKRFFNLYGMDEIKLLMSIIEEQISKRLSDGDFSFRFDRHKIYIVLPGKDKKYSVPLANSLKNDTIKIYEKKEMELLFSFITVQYPEDGNNIYSLIESLQ